MLPLQGGRSLNILDRRKRESFSLHVTVTLLFFRVVEKRLCDSDRDLFIGRVKMRALEEQVPRTVRFRIRATAKTGRSEEGTKYPSPRRREEWKRVGLGLRVTPRVPARSLGDFRPLLCLGMCHKKDLVSSPSRGLLSESIHAKCLPSRHLLHFQNTFFVRNLGNRFILCPKKLSLGGGRFVKGSPALVILITVLSYTFCREYIPILLV